MHLLLWFAVFVVSLAVLVKSSDLFVASSERVGLFLGLPPFVVGVVIVGVGTSLPELASSVLAVIAGCSEIVVGNVIGSNISNIFLVLGVAAVVGGRFRVRHDLMRMDLPILLASCFMLVLMIWDRMFTFGEAVLCLVGMAVYLISMTDDPEHPERQKAGMRWVTWLMLAVSPVGIFVGAKYSVDAIVKISEILHIGTEVIALSAVALGTSLPEVLVSVSATRKGNPEMAIGNIIGSNIFNTFGVMAIPSFFGPLAIPESILTISVPVFVAATLLYVVVTVDRRVNRNLGYLLLAFYAFFIGKIYGIV